MSETHYEIYTDGSFRPPNFGSYAVLIFKDSIEHACITAPVFNATINQAELLAIYMALNYFTDKVSINISSDSQYAVNCITKWAPHWNRNNWLTATGESVKNKQIIQSIYQLMKFHKVRVSWVRGHAGDVNNERCDKLARDITRAMLLKEILPP